MGGLGKESIQYHAFLGNPMRFVPLFNYQCLS